MTQERVLISVGLTFSFVLALLVIYKLQWKSDSAQNGKIRIEPLLISQKKYPKRKKKNYPDIAAYAEKTESQSEVERIAYFHLVRGKEFENYGVSILQTDKENAMKALDLAVRYYQLSTKDEDHLRLANYYIKKIQQILSAPENK